MLRPGHLVAFGLGLMVATCMSKAHAQAPAQPECRPIASFSKTAEALGFKSVQLAPEQWQFMRGMFIEAPGTPFRLPPGDRAGVLQYEGNALFAFFIDGDQVCDLAKISPEVAELIMSVGRGDITHAPAWQFHSVPNSGITTLPSYPLDPGIVGAPINGGQ